MSNNTTPPAPSGAGGLEQRAWHVFYRYKDLLLDALDNPSLTNDEEEHYLDELHKINDQIRALRRTILERE